MSHAVPRFHDLTVSRIHPEAAGSVAVSLRIPPELRDTFAFEPGQFLTVRASIDGQDVRRSYSISSPRSLYTAQGELTLGIRPVEGGLFSNWAATQLQAGDTLQVMPPDGRFTVHKPRAIHRVGFAAGSGITPILSMIRSFGELPPAPWKLIYLTRFPETAAFREELGAPELKSRVRIHHSHGDPARAFDLWPVLEKPNTAHVYCCGPLPMLEAYERATAGLPPERVHREYFAAKEAAATGGGFTVELARSRKTLEVPEGKSILDCLIEIQVEPPFSCREGVCGTCEVRVLEGTPDHRDLVLTDAERAVGDRMMVCCSGAKSPRLVLDL